MILFQNSPTDCIVCVLFQIQDRSGQIHLSQAELIYEENTLSEFSITGDDPLSARTTVQIEVTLEWPKSPEGPVKTKVGTTNTMWADEIHFFTDCKMEVFLNDETIFSKAWNKKYTREHV